VNATDFGLLLLLLLLLFVQKKAHRVTVDAKKRIDRNHRTNNTLSAEFQILIACNSNSVCQCASDASSPERLPCPEHSLTMR
jgi:hypothetical protein